MSSRPERLPGSRHKEIFPPGFDKKFDKYTSISRNGSHFSSKPEQLYYSLVERYDPETPIESIIVKSAWYGKQTKSAQHEFIVFQVEDIDVEGLTNYLVLDRDAGDVHQGSSRTIAPASSQTTKANDTFRISYDGDIKKLLEECQLTPYKFLEELKFDTETPLHLYEVVTLADVVSNRYPFYHALDSSCYLFAGVIWECIRLMRPSADYNDALAYKRGKCNWFRYIPSSSAKQETFQELQAKLPVIECDLWERRNAFGWPMTKIDEAYGPEERDYVHVVCPPAELLPSTVPSTRSMSMRLHPIQSLNRMILPGLRSQSPSWMKYLVPE